MCLWLIVLLSLCAMATSSTRFLHEISAVHRWLSRRLTCLLKNSGWKTILSFLKWLLSFGGHSFVFGVGNVSLPQQDRLLSLSKPWWPFFGGSFPKRNLQRPFFRFRVCFCKFDKETIYDSFVLNVSLSFQTCFNLLFFNDNGAKMTISSMFELTRPSWWLYDIQMVSFQEIILKNML